jgi:hypothetical protein
MSLSLNDKMLLTAGFSALLKMDLEPPVANSKGHFSLFDHHKKTFPHARVGEVESENSENMINIQIVNLVGNKIDYKVRRNDTVESLKEKIQDIDGVPPDNQRLFFMGQTLEDHKLLEDYNIDQESVIHIIMNLRGGGSSVIDFSCIDSPYNYDFTHIKDNADAFYRGGHKYTRPCGWKRFAINVKDKYESLEWLGCKNGPNEWPVSYHGTGLHEAKSIAQDGYDLTKGKRFQFGRGVYSTPDINVAEMYAIDFQHENKKYKLLLQNRVNPRTLIKIPAIQTTVGEYWINASDKDIRPYGICIRQI